MGNGNGRPVKDVSGDNKFRFLYGQWQLIIVATTQPPMKRSDSSMGNGNYSPLLIHAESPAFRFLYGQWQHDREAGKLTALGVQIPLWAMATRLLKSSSPAFTSSDSSMGNGNALNLVVRPISLASSDSSMGNGNLLSCWGSR